MQWICLWEENFEFVKNTYAKEDVSIDYSKITVFEDPTEFRSYLLSQNLAFNDCCKSLNDFYYVINDGRGQGAPDSYESQFYLGPHVFNYYSYDIKDHKNLIINWNEFDCDLKLNLKTCDILNTNNSQSMTLSGKEFALMEFLFRNKNQVVNREQIAERIWGYDNDSQYNNVEVYVSFLRKKIKFLESNVRIKAIRGMGYMLEEIHD